MFEPLHRRIEEHNDIDICRLNSKQLQSLKTYHIDSLLKKYLDRTHNNRCTCFIDNEILDNLNITVDLIIKYRPIIRDSYYKGFIKDHLKEYVMGNYKIDHLIVPQPEHKILYFRYPQFNWNHKETLIKYPEWFV